MNLSIKSLSEETQKYYLDCFSKNNDPKNPEVVNWQFFQNSHKNFVAIAFDETLGKTAAIYATFTSYFQIENSTVEGCQSLDTITDLDYRGQGLFVSMAKNIYNNAAKENVKLVYGFPNGNSVKGFRKHLGWQILDPVPFLIKPLKTKYFTQKIAALSFLPNFNLNIKTSHSDHHFFKLKEENHFPESSTDIWKHFSQNIAVALKRDADYLNWRYVKKPFENYKIVHCYNQKNEHIGFVVYTIKNKHNGKVAYIMELIYNLNYKKAAEKLLSYAINEINKNHADAILAWCLEHSPNYKIFKKYFFVNMPEKIRPIELHFGARSFDERMKPIIEKRENWYLSYSDSDTV